MLTTIYNEVEQFSVGDVVTLTTGGPRMTVTYVGPTEVDGGDWLLCQWFDEHGEFRQGKFAFDSVGREPRSISPGSVHMRQFAFAASYPA